jgi:hypothetical protein
MKYLAPLLVTALTLTACEEPSKQKSKDAQDLGRGKVGKFLANDTSEDVPPVQTIYKPYKPYKPHKQQKNKYSYESPIYPPPYSKDSVLHELDKIKCNVQFANSNGTKKSFELEQKDLRCNDSGCRSAYGFRNEIVAEEVANFINWKKCYPGEIVSISRYLDGTDSNSTTSSNSNCSNGFCESVVRYADICSLSTGGDRYGKQSYSSDMEFKFLRNKWSEEILTNYEDGMVSYLPYNIFRPGQLNYKYSMENKNYTYSYDKKKVEVEFTCEKEGTGGEMRGLSLSELPRKVSNDSFDDFYMKLDKKQRSSSTEYYETPNVFKVTILDPIKVKQVLDSKDLVFSDGRVANRRDLYSTNTFACRFNKNGNYSHGDTITLTTSIIPISMADAYSGYSSLSSQSLSQILKDETGYIRFDLDNGQFYCMIYNSDKRTDFFMGDIQKALGSIMQISL